MSGSGHIDFSLKFLHQAFDLESLHFGLFTDECPRTLRGLRQAQAEYTRTLVGLVPEGAGPVLDVGSGLGDVSRALAEAGFAVEGLSPDPHLGEQFRLTCGPEVPFHLSKFETFSPGRTYGCLVFGESPQYIENEAFFPKCRELTAPGAHLVVAEVFQIQPGRPQSTCFFEDDFVARAERAGFSVAHRRDITAETLPTLEIGRLFLGYGQRLFDFGCDAARRRAPIRWKLARALYGRKLDRVHALLHEKLPRWLDSEHFTSTMRYVMYRLTRPTAGRP